MNDNERPPEPDSSLPRDLLALPASDSSHSGQDWSSASDTTRTWRQDFARWLATLNPGRTPREYEKAVGYFFDTPGVPQHLDELTFDLLLAYRGALALRATPHEQHVHMPVKSTRELRLPAPAAGAIEGDTFATYAAESAASDAVAPLAPATVNVRLTALRQFLVYCSLAGTLPHLSPDRIRAALRRLSIERRRPYQILAEQEWDQFLQAAELPRRMQPTPPAHEPIPGEEEVVAEGADTDLPDQSAPSLHITLPKSRSGLTGERTAER